MKIFSYRARINNEQFVHMHDRNVFHKALSDQSSYVVCSENIKIIQFLEWNDKKFGDLRSFRD